MTCESSSLHEAIFTVHHVRMRGQVGIYTALRTVHGLSRVARTTLPNQRVLSSASKPLTSPLASATGA